MEPTLNLLGQYPDLFLIGLPIFILFITFERLYYRRQAKTYPHRQNIAMAAVGVGFIITKGLSQLVLTGVYLAVWQWRVAEIPLNTWYGWLGLFLLVEFAYYWFHRVSHENRWFWASHSVHHTSEEMNFMVAFCLSWTSLLAGPWFFLLPIVLLGFHPSAVVFVMAANLVFQFFLHTESIGKLGWIEYVFNTPSHHRVHHSRKPEHLDTNYGGILIIFDRLFGTFVEESEAVPVEYGLVHPHGSLNPFKIALYQWYQLFRDIFSASSVREALLYIIKPPGWKPEP